jgi:hypothetical protein
VRDSDTGSELDRHTYDLAALGGFPATLELVRGRATPQRVHVDGYVHSGADVIAAGTADAQFVDGEQSDVDVQLADLAVVRASSSGIASGQASLAIDQPPGVVAGDLLVAMVSHDSGMTYSIPAPAGWTYESSLGASVSFGARVYVFWKVAGTAEPASYAFTPEPAYSGDMAGGIWSIGGADPASPIAAGSVQADMAPATSCVAPSITLAGPSLTMYACAKNNALTSFTPPDGMTEDWDRSSNANYAMAVEGAHDLTLNGPTGDRSAETTNINDAGIGLLFAIAAAH